MKDDVPTGAIIINKDGEFVTDTTLMKGHWYDFIFNFFKDSLAGVEFEVYAAEDIVSPDGLETVYYEADEVIEFEVEFENTPIKVEISKTDITGDNELEGAVLSVIDSEGNLVEKWTSGKAAHLIERLPAGKYTLREETAPFGYVIAQDIEFEVKETTEIQKVAMKDEAAVGKIIINKTSEDGKALAGAKFEIRDKDGNVAWTVVTDKNGHAESGVLPIATFKDGKYEAAVTYTVVEVEAPKGYILDSTPKEVTFEYKDGKTAVIEYTLDVVNKPTEPKLPQTGDSMNLWLFAGAGVMLLLSGIGAVSYKKKRK